MKFTEQLTPVNRSDKVLVMSGQHINIVLPSSLHAHHDVRHVPDPDVPFGKGKYETWIVVKFGDFPVWEMKWRDGTSQPSPDEIDVVVGAKLKALFNPSLTLESIN